MKSIFFILSFLLFPAAIFCQDIELADTDLNGNDVLDWNIAKITIPSPSAKMILADSSVIQSNADNDAFYGATTVVLKAAGFEIEGGADYKKSGMKAHKNMHGVDYELIVSYFPKIFRSLTVPNNAKIITYASAAKTDLNAADVKAIDKIKGDITKATNIVKKKDKFTPTMTADEQRVYNQFSRRSLPAVNLINGINTLQQIADKSGMQKEEVAQIFAFMIQKGFAHVAKKSDS